MMLKVKLDEGAKRPVRANAGDAGLDLYARETKTIPPRGIEVFDTGVHMEIPFGYCGMIISKSGLMCKQGITSDGLVDSGYTGSIAVALINHSDKEYTVQEGDKISQIVIAPCSMAWTIETDEISGGERGDNGFGSSGR